MSDVSDYLHKLQMEGLECPVSETRDPNEKAKQWVKAFKSLCRTIPASIEVSVGHGSISFHELGEWDASFEKAGHHDNVPSFTSVQTKRIYPNSESM